MRSPPLPPFFSAMLKPFRLSRRFFPDSVLGRPFGAVSFSSSPDIIFDAYLPPLV
jgi:hypothetical protein